MSKGIQERQVASKRELVLHGAFVLVALCLAAITVATSPAATSGELESRHRHLVRVFRAEEIRELRVQRDRTLRIRRSGDSWLLSGEATGQGEAATVDQLLRTLRFSTWLRPVPKNNVDTQGFGLDAPALVLHLLMGDFHYRLRLGGPAASPDGARYLEVTGENAPGKGVYVVNKSTAKDLDLPFKAFRVKQLIPYPERELLSLSLKTLDEEPERSVRLKQHARNDWRFDGELDNVRLDRFGVDRLFIELSRTQAEDFLDLKAAESALSAAGNRYQLKLQPSNKELQPAELLVGGLCPKRPELQIIVRKAPEPLAACGPAGLVRTLLGQRELLVDRGVFQLRSDEVVSISAGPSGKGAELELVRAGGGFKLRLPESKDLEAGLGKAWLSELLAARGRRVEGENDFHPWRSLALSSVSATGGEGSVERVELQRPADDGTLRIRRLGDGAVIEVGSQDALPFLKDVTLLRSRQLVDVRSEDLRSISVDSREVGFSVEASKDGGYLLRRPQELAVDPGLAHDLFKTVSKLSVEDWVAPRDTGQFGLEKPTLIVGFSTPDQTRKLVVGSLSPRGGKFAQLDGGAVCRLAPATLDRIDQWILSRSGFTLQTSSTQRIELRSAAGRYVLEKLGTAFVAGEDSLPLDSSRISTLVDALSHVRPLRAITSRPAQAHHGFTPPLLSVAYKIQTRVDEPAAWQRWELGAGDLHRHQNVHYLRRPGKPGVFVVPRQTVARLLESLQ